MNAGQTNVPIGWPSCTPFCAVAAGLAATLLFSGCASIVSGRHAEVAVHSNPANAHVVVRDKRGHEVASTHTPGKVVLRRKDKFIFPARYTATISAPGYQTAQVPIRSTLNPWVVGNLVFGGIPGLVVDNATGAAWKPKRAEYFADLRPAYPGQYALPESAVQPATFGTENTSTVPTVQNAAQVAPPPVPGGANKRFD